MDKQSIYLLQKVDCNCNDCYFMDRDLQAFNMWDIFHKDLQLKEFERKKELALRVANECKDSKGKETLLKIANKMRFLFSREGRLQYGVCKKFSKPVSFIPMVCQIETQKCFIHRKDIL